METAFPLASFKRQEYFPSAIQVTEPLWIFWVHEVAPYVFVDFHEPIEAFLLAGQLVALNHRDERLDVYPPKFLIPFELLKRTAQTIHEVEDAASRRAM